MLFVDFASMWERIKRRYWFIPVSLILPAAALLLVGSGVLVYIVLRRRPEGGSVR